MFTYAYNKTQLIFLLAIVLSVLPTLPFTCRYMTKHASYPGITTKKMISIFPLCNFYFNVTEPMVPAGKFKGFMAAIMTWLTATDYLSHMTTDKYRCRRHNSVLLSSLLSQDWYITRETRRVVLTEHELLTLPRTPEFISRFKLCSCCSISVVFWRQLFLSFCPLSCVLLLVYIYWYTTRIYFNDLNIHV